MVLPSLETAPYSPDMSDSMPYPELTSAVEYWAAALSRYDRNLPLWKIHIFRDELYSSLKRRVEGHWYPEQPDRGQGYRALLCAERVDGVLLDALRKAGLHGLDFRKIQNEHYLIMYIDPGHVSLRVSPSYMLYSKRAEITQTLFPAQVNVQA